MERWYFALGDDGAIEFVNAYAQNRGVQLRLKPGRVFFHDLSYDRLHLLRAGEIEVDEAGKAKIV